MRMGLENNLSPYCPAIGFILTCSDMTMKREAAMKNVAPNYRELTIGTRRTVGLDGGRPPLLSQPNFRFCPLSVQSNTS